MPILFGPDSSTTDYSFLDAVTTQIKADVEVEYVLGFNEPDGESDSGGRNIHVDIAAKTWIRQMEPLRKHGVKLGGPVVTGSSSGSCGCRISSQSVWVNAAPISFRCNGMAVSRSWLAISDKLGRSIQI